MVLAHPPLPHPPRPHHHRYHCDPLLNYQSISEHDSCTSPYLDFLKRGARARDWWLATTLRQRATIGSIEVMLGAMIIDHALRKGWITILIRFTRGVQTVSCA